MTNLNLTKISSNTRTHLEALTIKEGGTLTFKDGVTFVIENPFAGKWGIKINPGVTKPAGQFIIDSPAKSTYIYTPNTEPEKYYTYPFKNWGTVSFLGSNVLYTYGPSDTSQPGGIQNLQGSTCIIDNCNLLEADTHSLYIDGTADVRVKGAGTIGSDRATSPQANGHGIFIKGACPIIEDVSIKNNKLDGIHIEDSTFYDEISANELRNYAPSVYDYRVTADPASSTKPKVAVGGSGQIYIAWLDDRTGENQVYFKMMTPDGSWTSDQQLSTEYGSTASQVDIAAIGDYIHIVFVYPPLSQWYNRLMYTRSTDGGNTWETPHAIGFGVNPSIEVSDTPEGLFVYVAYQTTLSNPEHWNGEIGSQIYIALSMNNGFTWQDIMLPHTSYYQSSLPKIAASMNYVYMVWGYWGELRYIFSADYGKPGTWFPSDEPYPVIATYLFEGFTFDSFDITARGNHLYVVWESQKTITDGTDIHYKHGVPLFDSWSDDIIISSSLDLTFYHPRIALDASNNVHVVWQDDRTGLENIRYSCVDMADNVLVNDIALTEAQFCSKSPEICISNDYVNLVWADNRSSDFEVYIKRAIPLEFTNLIINENANGVIVKNSNVVIDNNKDFWCNAYNSIGIYGQSTACISNNNIMGNSGSEKDFSIRGIDVGYGANTLIVGNQILYCGVGIYSKESKITIDNNNIRGAEDISQGQNYGVCGIYDEGSKIRIQNENEIIAFEIGIQLSHSVEAVVTGHNIIKPCHDNFEPPIQDPHDGNSAAVKELPPTGIFPRVGIFSTDVNYLEVSDDNEMTVTHQGIVVEGTALINTKTTILDNNILCYFTFDPREIAPSKEDYGIYVGGGTVSISSNSIECIGPSRGAGICIGTSLLFNPTTSTPPETGVLMVTGNHVVKFEIGLLLGSTSPSISISDNYCDSSRSNGIVIQYVMATSIFISNNHLKYTQGDVIILNKSTATSFILINNEILLNDGWGIRILDSQLTNSNTLYNDNTICSKLGNIICQWSFGIYTQMLFPTGEIIHSNIYIKEHDNTEVVNEITDEQGRLGLFYLIQYHISADGEKYFHTPHVLRVEPLYKDKYIAPIERSLIADQSNPLYRISFSLIEETLDFYLPYGISYISLPLVNDDLQTADDLANLIGPGLISISLWDPVTAQTYTYPFTNFNLVPYAHYAVTISSSGTSFTLTGERAGWVNMNLVPASRNDIGWIGFDNILASDFSKLVQNFQSIGYYNGIGWQYYDGNPANDFIMERGQGYRLFVSDASIMSYSEGMLDLDNDGLTYGEEIFLYGTDYFDPLVDWDTDGDGMDDCWEAEYYHDGEGTLPTMPDANEDIDGDSLVNLIECKLKSNPICQDTDKDGLLDSEEDVDQDGEVDTGETNPTKYDTDGDGMGDNYEIKCSLAGGLWEPTAYDKRFAVLYVGGKDKDSNHAKYWNKIVELYDTLIIDYGYKKENVFVLYADGNPPNPDNCHNYQDCIKIEDHKDMIYSDATKLRSLFFFENELKYKVDSDSFLYVWVYDHGGADGLSAYIRCWGAENEDIIYDFEFSNWFVNYNYKRIVFTMGQCKSGGFIDNIQSLPGEVIISTAVTGLEDSYSWDLKGYLYHYWRAVSPCCGDLGAGCAIYAKGRYSGTSPDQDGNNIISMTEAYNYAHDNDKDYFPESPSAYWESYHGLSSVTYL